MFEALSSKFTDFWVEQYRDAFGGGMSSLGDAVREAINPELVKLGAIEVDPAIFTAFGVTVVIILAALIIRILVIPRFKKYPRGLQLMLESIVSYFDKSAEHAVHRHASFVGPYTFTAALFISLGTLAELLGLRPSFASVNTCFAMGLTTFLVINICGIGEKKIGGRLKRYLNPIHLITDLSVPLSLSLRLFGAILSGFIIAELLYAVIALSFVLPAAAAVITTIVHAFLQAYLFATLTNIFVGEAVE
ncbi:MAG: F0F1 ATP synthase subunit A [Clostridiaceae bacterium]|jgi:F-type H+-transporting ATPase subunit a|nr:F0F1 ATP synthase subunit A [Clostridiaceae bacterium]